MSAKSLLISCLVLLLAACTYTMKIRDGKTAFERKQYSKAINLLKNEYHDTKSRVEQGKLAFMLAESYRLNEQPASSVSWYETAYNFQYGPEALKGYAYALKSLERYEEAKQAFKNLGIEIGSIYEYRREITACDNAIAWQKQAEQSGYQIRPVDFNTAFHEFGAVPYKENLVFTSDRSASEGDETYHWTGNEFMDLFTVDPETGFVRPFDEKINTESNEGSIAFGPDYQTCIFTRCFDTGLGDIVHCKLMMSFMEDGQWSAPVFLPFTEDGVDYRHPAFSQDGRTLYFASNHPDGWGGYDIYTSKRNDDNNKWSPPELMGRSINSIGDEVFPTTVADTLYFSSDFLSGMGGLDIFSSYNYQGAWTPARNLKAPINSGADDFAFIITNDHRDTAVIQSGYFTSSRLGGSGYDDIYRFEQRKPEAEPELPAREVEFSYHLDGYVLEKIFSDPLDPNSQLLGRKPLDGSKVRVQSGNDSWSFDIGEDGYFTMPLDTGRIYILTAAKDGYFTTESSLSTKKVIATPAQPELRFEVELILDKIYEEKEIVLENIYYDFDRWEIREDAEPTLDELASLLKSNPDIRIELGSHTDCRGNANYNEDLSQKRAQSAVDYLIESGINADRLIARGYGENLPAVDCVCSKCTEEQHQENRRTTFKVLSQ